MYGDVHQCMVVYISGQFCASMDSGVHHWTSVVGWLFTSLDTGVHQAISMNIMIEPTMINHYGSDD